MNTDGFGFHSNSGGGGGGGSPVIILGSGTGSSYRCGNSNLASGDYSTISGGNCNEITASGNYSIISGGSGNTVSGCFSGVVSGSSNYIQGNYGSASGYKNTVSGNYSHAYGCGLSALCKCTFYTNNHCACGSFFTSSIPAGCAVCVDNNSELIGFSLSPTVNFGLFAQTASLSPITNTTAEETLIDGGVGTLTVGANQFTVGDSFKATMYGHITCPNNRQLRIRIKANSVLLGDTGTIVLPQTTSQHWSLEILFTIRNLGTAGVASIATSGQFTYTKDASNAYEGEDFVTIENTNFDTTINNTLDITAEWGNASLNNSIYSDTFTLTKVY